MPRKLVTLLSIAGSDPTGGAGVQCDIKCGSSLGLHVVTAITGVTVQNSTDFYSINPVCPELLESQLNAIISDVTPDAVKIGMIASTGNIDVVSNFLKKLPEDIPVIIDPILNSTSGNRNLISVEESDKITGQFKNLLFPFAEVITPNYSELLKLTGKNDKIKLDSSLLQLLNTKAIIITGENIDSDFKDTLLEKNGTNTVINKKIDCQNLHGTGCAFSSFLASFMALGHSLKDAFFLTSKKINDIISNSCDYRMGRSNYGPLNIIEYANISQ